jgi:hypothetical protein
VNWKSLAHLQVAASAEGAYNNTENIETAFMMRIDNSV